MGIIEKKIRGRSNQKLAEPLSTVTRLQPAEVLAAVKEVVERHNRALVEKNTARQSQGGGKLRRFLTDVDALGIPRRSYYLKVRDKDILIGYEKPVDDILARVARKRKPGVTEGYWLAHLRMMRDSSGQTRVEVRLTNWVTDSDGKLGNKDKYRELTDLLWDAVGADADAAQVGQDSLFE